MSNSYGITPTSGTGPTMAWEATYLSPDALLAYCQEQLGSLDHEIKTQMDAQKLQLRERTAVETVQTTLEQFGTAGPSRGDQMTACVDAFDKAIASLPIDDPVASQLAQQREKMKTDYGYVPAHTQQVESDRGPVNVSTTDVAASMNTPTDGQWKGTTDALSNLAGDIKSNSDIDMLKLQDLVSQRQQAVQLASSMMSKEDQTLENLSKAIGQ